MSVAILDVLVGGSALLKREVSFSSTLEVSGLLGPRERLSGTSSSWSPSNSSLRLGRNIPAEAKRYNSSYEWGLFFAKYRTSAR